MYEGILRRGECNRQLYLNEMTSFRNLLPDGKKWNLEYESSDLPVSMRVYQKPVCTQITQKVPKIIKPRVL